MSEETKVIYYKSDEEKVPYMIKLNIAPDKATLKDFKNALNLNAKCFKFFFQAIVEDFGVVKEEISDDDMKLPFVNGRSICWLVQTEGSLVGSDTRSQNSLIMNDQQTNQPNNNGDTNGGLNNNNNYQFTSMQSVSSNGSSISNNENIERNNYRQHKSSSGQIYDTLNNRKTSKLRQMTPLKDANTDDTTTETESIISGIDDMKIHRPSSAQANLNGLSGGSLRRGSSSKPQFSSFNNHNQVNKKPTKQKLSLDNHYNNRHQNNPNAHYLTHYPSTQNPSAFHNQILNLKNGTGNRNGQEFADSFSEDSNEEDDDDDITIDDKKMNRYMKGGAAPSIISSELDTTTFFDTENDDDDRFSSYTEQTNSTMSSRHYGHNRNRRRMRHKLQHSHYKSNSSLHSSVSSLTDSTMSLNIITVTLNMDSVNFLGISIVGQSNKGGEGGIYVGSIMSGGAVALDGRIEPGDMILQVNEVSFENMSNDDAVRVLREAVMKPGPVKLVVAKCWDPNPQGYFTVSKQEPVRPIDPSAWVAHTQAHTGIYPIGSNANIYNRQNQVYSNNNQNMNKLHHNRLTHSVSTFGSSSSLSSSLADTTISTTYNNGIPNNYKNYNYGNNLGTTTTTNADSTRFGNEHLNLTIKTDMETLVRAMAAPDSGLEVRDRNWLKITIPNAFIGSEVVDWLFNHVEGFPDRRDARKYACDMLKYGFIRHAVNKVRFSEQCYYVFGDFNQSTLNSQTMTMNGGGNLFTLNEENELDFDSVSELDRDAMYAPMNFPPPPPGSFNNYQHHPRLYSNLNGIGGPPPPPSYLSSSSSNATSTSTTSNNTTTQTIATTTTAMGFNAGSSSSGVGGSSMTSSNSNTTANTTNTQSSFGGGILNSDRQNACQFYYPPPSLQITSFSNNNTISSLSSSIFQNNKPTNTMLSSQMDSQNETVNQTTQQSQYSNESRSDFCQSQFSTNGYNYTTQLTTPYYQGMNKLENRSIRSSDNSSSGNGSDVELLSSSKTKRKQLKDNNPKLTANMLTANNKYNQIQSSTNYYEIGPLDSSNKSINNTIESNSLNNSGGSKQRSLDKIPNELRSSKVSFQQAMGNPCEFFVDVM